MNENGDDLRAIVKVFFRNLPIGLYRARNFTKSGMLLEHGPIVFPRGSNLKLDSVAKDGFPYSGLEAEVVHTDAAGMQLRFNYALKPDRNDQQWYVDWQMPACLP